MSLTDLPPLAFGQLSVHRILQTYPLERWPETYLTSTLDLPEGLGVAAIEAALTTLAERHDALRTRFVEHDGGLRQLVEPRPVVAVTVIEQADLTAATAAEHTVAAARPRFRREAEPAWRALILTQRGAPAWLGLVVDHIVSDQFGLRRLIAELLALLGLPDEVGRKHLTSQPVQPVELAQLQRSDSWAARRRGAADYWRRLLRDLPPALFPVPAPAGEDGAGRIEAVLRSSGARAALAAASHRIKASPQTVLLALTALAVHRSIGTDPAVLTLQASNRYSPWEDIVTSMNQYTPLAVAVPAADVGLDAFVRQVHWAGLNAYRHGSYDVDEIWRAVADERGRIPDFDHFFNFMADDVTPQPDADATGHDAARVESGDPRRQIGPTFDVKVRGGPELALVVRAAPALVDQAALEELMWWFDRSLRLVAVDGSVAVGQLIAR